MYYFSLSPSNYPDPVSFVPSIYPNKKNDITKCNFIPLPYFQKIPQFCTHANLSWGVVLQIFVIEIYSPLPYCKSTSYKLMNESIHGNAGNTFNVY